VLDVLEQFQLFEDIEHLETSIRAERGYTTSVVLLGGEDAQTNENMVKQRSHVVRQRSHVVKQRSHTWSNRGHTWLDRGGQTEVTHGQTEVTRGQTEVTRGQTEVTHGRDLAGVDGLAGRTGGRWCPTYEQGRPRRHAQRVSR